MAVDIKTGELIEKGVRRCLEYMPSTSDIDENRMILFGCCLRKFDQ